MRLAVLPSGEEMLPQRFAWAALAKATVEVSDIGAVFLGSRPVSSTGVTFFHGNDGTEVRKWPSTSLRLRPGGISSGLARAGAPTAPAGHRLPLLPSSLAGFTSPAPRGTRPSAPFPGKSALAPCLGEGFHPAMAGAGNRAPPAPHVARPLATMVFLRFLTVNQDGRNGSVPF